MSRFCKKCGKEIPQNSKKNLCENCRNKTNGKVRKFCEVALTVAGTVGSIALVVITKGKFRGPKA